MPGPGNVGERVRNLRLTRRLSQAQLAGHDLSDSYISLIESGKRTPTPAVLRLLAERLGCTSEYLAEGIEPEQRAHLEVRERHARLALLNGEPLAALSGFDDVIARSDDPEVTVRAQWGRAGALEKLGRTEAAIGALEELREQAERDAGRSSWLPAVIALARCYHAVGDLGQAIALGERVLARLHELGLTVGEEHTETGRVLLLAYVDRFDPDRAHGLGRQLLQIEEPSGATLAAAYWRASTQAIEEGAVGDALYMADRAIGASGEGARPRSRARLQVAGARALLRGVPGYTVPADPASATARSATAHAAAQEALTLLQAASGELEGTDVAECAIETARALVVVGDPSDAVDRLRGALDDPGGTLPDSTAPEARILELVRGRLVIARARLAQGDRVAAASELGALAERIGESLRGRAAAQAYREIGELFEESGDADGATAAYRRSLESAGLRPSPRPLHTSHNLAGR